jgi:hypothetical protein
VALQYGADGDRSRIVDLAAADLADYFRVPTKAQGSLASQGSQGESVWPDVKVGDHVEIFSQSMGGWQPAVVVERDGNDVALQYGADGDRSRIVDLAAADLADYFRVPDAASRQSSREMSRGSSRGQSKESSRASSRGSSSDTVENAVVAPLDGLALDEPVGQDEALLVIAEDDEVEVYSQSMGGWQPATILERRNDGREIVLEYAGRSRVIDLTQEGARDVIRIATKDRPQSSQAAPEFGVTQSEFFAAVVEGEEDESDEEMTSPKASPSPRRLQPEPEPEPEPEPQPQPQPQPQPEPELGVWPDVKVGDRVEIFSQSMGGWQPAVVVERNGDEVAVEYGEDGSRSRIIDLTADDLAEYLLRPIFV